MIARAAIAIAALLFGTGCRPDPARHLVEIRDLAFAPATLEVAVGDTIVWQNRDLFPHTSTASGAAGWDTRGIPAGGEGSAVARRPGRYEYICEVHPTMRGVITVR
jgi:plastocyanin